MYNGNIIIIWMHDYHLMLCPLDVRTLIRSLLTKSAGDLISFDTHFLTLSYNMNILDNCGYISIRY